MKLSPQHKKIRNILFIIIGIVLFGIGFFLLRTGAANNGFLQTLPYLLIGVGCGIFGYGSGDLLSQLALSKDPALAKEIEIMSEDERNQALGNMAKAKGYNLMTYLLAALMLAFALMQVSFTVLIPLVIAYLFIQFYTVYCRIKLEKEY